MTAEYVGVQDLVGNPLLPGIHYLGTRRSLANLPVMMLLHRITKYHAHSAPDFTSACRAWTPEVLLPMPRALRMLRKGWPRR
jgi:hypothetical protein